MSCNRRCRCSITNLMLKAAVWNKEERKKRWQGKSIYIWGFFPPSEFLFLRKAGELKSSCAIGNTANMGSHTGQRTAVKSKLKPVQHSSICLKRYMQHKQWDSFLTLLLPMLVFGLPNSSDIILRYNNSYLRRKITLLPLCKLPYITVTSTVSSQVKHHVRYSNWKD